MAAQGGVAFQEKVSRLVSRQNGKPVLKPSRALALGDTVSNRNPKKRGEQGEQSMLWMRGVFDNVAGSAETALVCNILDGWKRGPDDLLCGRLSEATCITEISVLMACWKQNNFVDSLCCNETNAFYTCVAKAQAAMKNNSGQSNIQGGRLPPKQATILLKRYPNQRSEI
uniref:CHCH domain-containing protein n=1 Tax=Amphiprion ocellaris TaxID=80972 RepID=A0AAQ6A490_AMPOC